MVGCVPDKSGLRGEAAAAAGGIDAFYQLEEIERGDFLLLHKGEECFQSGGYEGGAAFVGVSEHGGIEAGTLGCRAAECDGFEVHGRCRIADKMVRVKYSYKYYVQYLLTIGSTTCKMRRV